MTRIRPSVPRIRPGQPGHGGSQTTLRLRPVLIINGEPVDGWTSQWEIICPTCGDNRDLDFRTVSPYLQRVRGPYTSEVEGQAALRRHRGQPVTTASAGPGGQISAAPSGPSAQPAQPDLSGGIAAAQP